MSTMDQDIDFYGWSKESIERGLEVMGCQGVSTSPLLSGSKSVSYRRGCDVVEISLLLLYEALLCKTLGALH